MTRMKRQALFMAAAVVFSFWLANRSSNGFAFPPPLQKLRLPADAQSLRITRSLYGPDFSLERYDFLYSADPELLRGLTEQLDGRWVLHGGSPSGRENMDVRLLDRLWYLNDRTLASVTLNFNEDRRNVVVLVNGHSYRLPGGLDLSAAEAALNARAEALPEMEAWAQEEGIVVEVDPEGMEAVVCRKDTTEDPLFYRLGPAVFEAAGCGYSGPSWSGVRAGDRIWLIGGEDFSDSGGRWGLPAPARIAEVTLRRVESGYTASAGDLVLYPNDLQIVSTLWEEWKARHPGGD